MVRKYTAPGFSSAIALMPTTPAVCAMPSIISTPGNTGRSGKCPVNPGSVMVTFFMPMQLQSSRMLMTRSISRNG